MLEKITKISIFFVLSLLIGTTNLFAGDFTNFNQKWSIESTSLGTKYFADNLNVGESKTKTIQANEPYNYTNIYLRAGKKYKFAVGSPEWNNGNRETTAAGYDESKTNYRRYSKYKTMALVGEIYNSNSPTAWTGKEFLIGLGRPTYTATADGYLVVFANDCLGITTFPYNCYIDNSRVVTLTVTRLE